MPAPASFNLMGGTFIQDSNGNGPMKAYVAEWSPSAWDAGPQNGRCSYFHQWKKNPYPDLVEYATTQRGAQASVVVQRGHSQALSNGSSGLRSAGDYYPTPQAIMNRNSETTSKAEKKNRPVRQDPGATRLWLRRSETPMKPLPQLTGKTDKASAALVSNVKPHLNNRYLTT